MTPEVKKAICQVLDSQRGLLSEATQRELGRVGAMH